jgi:fatty acid desaturase
MGLSPEEERHIQNLSVIPAALVIYVFLGYLIYLIHIKSPLARSPLFYMQYLMLIFLLVFPATYFAAEQVLRSRREKRPLAFYTKRFVGNMLLAIIALIIFEAVWEVANLALSSLTNLRMLVIITYIAVMSIFVFIVFHFREELSRLSKGDW